MAFLLLMLNVILVAVIIIGAGQSVEAQPQRPSAGIGPVPRPGELSVISAQPEKIRRLVPEIHDHTGPVREISAKTPEGLVLRFALNEQSGKAAVFLEKRTQETILFSFDRQRLNRVLSDGRPVSLSRVRGPTREKAGLLFQRLNALSLSTELTQPEARS